jgi:hypothetical protein
VVGYVRNFFFEVERPYAYQLVFPVHVIEQSKPSALPELTFKADANLVDMSADSLQLVTGAGILLDDFQGLRKITLEGRKLL